MTNEGCVKQSENETEHRRCEGFCIEEIKRKYNEAVAKAGEICDKELRQWLKERNLDGKVKRRDGKIGYLDMDIYHDIHFYLAKKDGTRSLHPCGTFYYSQMADYFQPYKESEE